MNALKKLKIITPLLIAAVPVILFQSCGEQKADAKSMEQIRAEEGVPVKIEVLQYKPFEKYYSFFGKLSGIKEATKGAMVAGKIDKILAKVGDNVKKDQIIVAFAQDNPTLQYEQAKSAFENSEKTYLRMKALLAAGETAQANYDGAETKYLVDKRNYESLKQMLFIESPFDGKVVDIKVNAGDNVKSEVHLFTVAQLSKMRTKIWASEKEISAIKKGMEAEIDYGGTKHTGKVVEVSMAADPYKQAFYAEVEFNNPGLELKSGVTVDIKILIYKNPNAIIIPRNLVMSDEKGTYVFVEKNQTAEKRYVTNGRDSGVDYEIKSGLKVNDRLIVEGTTLLNDGTKVKIIQ